MITNFLCNFFNWLQTRIKSTSGDNDGITDYDPEEVEVFEVGMKNTLMDGRLQLNVSAYQNEITGLQSLKLLEDLLSMKMQMQLLGG